MIRAIGLVLATVVLSIACPAANLAAQGAPPEAAQSPSREITPAEAQQQFQRWVAAAFGPRPEPKQPEWFPVEPKVQEWVEQVLEYWEERSEKVKTLECTFQKWDYDPQYTPARVKLLRDQGQLEKLPFARYSSGVIKYAAPDKGLFRVDRQQVIQPGNVAAQPTYSTEPKENGPHWVTDGKRFLMFDVIRKEVLETQLPPEWQGLPLRYVSPFPYWDSLGAFQFPSVRAETLQDRFWIRPLQAEGKGEYCLELVPKTKQDAANFHYLQIVLDEADFLPVKMLVFEYDWSPTHPHRTAYHFDKRVVNRTNFDFRDFTEVKIPVGWRRVIRDVNGNILNPGGSVLPRYVPIVP